MMQLSIVGMSCRFPGGVTNSLDYWKLILDGNQSLGCIPFDRWDISSLAARLNLSQKAKMQILHGSFVHDMEFFDPPVFSISMTEAESMSPLLRDLIECAYLALLDTGYTLNEMKGLSCGIFVGTSASSGERPTNSARNSLSSRYSDTGASVSIASG